MRGQVNIFPKVIFVFFMGAIVLIANTIVKEGYKRLWEIKEKKDLIDVMDTRIDGNNYTFLGFEGKSLKVGKIIGGNEDIAKIKGMIEISCIANTTLVERVKIKEKLRIEKRKICNGAYCLGLRVESKEKEILPGEKTIITKCEKGKGVVIT